MEEQCNEVLMCRTRSSERVRIETNGQYQLTTYDSCRTRSSERVRIETQDSYIPSPEGR